MNKILNRKKLLIFLCTTAVFSTIGATVCLKDLKNFALAQGKNVSVTFEEVEMEVSGLSSVYYQGEKLNAQECVLTYEGNEVVAISELVYPNGNVLSANEYLLDTMGRYQLIFRVDYQNKQLVKKVQFDVIKNNFAVSSSDDFVEFEYEYKGKTGTAVTLHNEGELTYNTVIDISSMTKDDVLFEMYPMPETLGVGDFDYFELKLTDHYDSSNYIVISFNYFDIYKIGYYAAGAYNQPKTGYEYQKDRLHIGTVYGAAIATYLYGTNHNGTEKVAPVQIRFDYEEKSFYAGDSPATGFVIDLDDSKYFSNLWEGFTTGEVDLSFKAGSYLSDRPANILVTKIANHNLSVKEVKDTTAPKIEIDMEDYDEKNLPNGLVGEKYPVFPYTCTDDNFEVISNVAVYGNYYSSSRFNVSIKDGYFYPDSVGMYYIEYYAKDYSGNETVKILPVQVVQESEWQNIEMSVNEEFFEKTYYAGYMIQIPVCEHSGGFGALNLETVVTLGDESFTIGKDQVFQPKKSGNYTVTYTSMDIVGKSVSISYTLMVEISDNPVFLASPIYKKYLIAGSQYTFAKLDAYDYWNDVENVVETKLRVIDGNGERLLDDLHYTPLATDSSVKVQYVAQTSRGLMTTEYFEIPVINVKNQDNLYDLTKYFYGDNIVTTATENEVIVKTDSSFDFINELLADGFSLELGLAQSTFKANSLRLRLTDTINEEESIVVDVRIVEEKLEVSINNGAWLSAVNGKSNELLTLSWDNQTKMLVYGDYGKATIAKTRFGKDFAGFTSGKVYLSFEMNNATEESQLRIMKINKQTFSTVQYDLQKPAISYSNDIQTTGIYGNRYIISKAYAADVLDPNISFRMQVTAPDGEFVKDVNGVELFDVSPSLDYEIELNMYGTYYIQYYAEDSSKKKESNIGFGVVVLDFEQPKIILNGKGQIKGVVNEEIYVPNATAIDNRDEEVIVKKFVVLPSGIRQEVKEEKIIFQTAGTYIVNYYAYDSSGNFTVYSYTITIS